MLYPFAKRAGSGMLYIVMFEDVLIRILADWLVIPIVLIGGVAMLLLPSTVRYERIARGVFAGLVALFLAKLISLLYQGERPFQELGEAPRAAYLNNPGFPSDHALLVFTITAIVWASTKNRPLALTLLGLSVLVATGRVVALVHTPIDVLGGFACAVAAVLLVYGRKIFTLR
ncbi:MAG: phosphatase PAP2 family protein [Candidatus Saccharimonadales bacterium]